MLKFAPFVVVSALLLLLWLELPCRVDTEQAVVPSQVIGIALTINHVTATRRDNNGTLHDLGRVEAASEYIELLQRLALHKL